MRRLVALLCCFLFSQAKSILDNSDHSNNIVFQLHARRRHCRPRRLAVDDHTLTGRR
jgi:hypothetical protein